jgi:hypothetical protein
MNVAFRVLLVLGLLAPSVALAQSSASLGNPRVEPPIVQEGQPVTLVLTGIPCGRYDPPVFGVSNFIVTVTQAVSPACTLPSGVFEVEFSLGTFPPGTYTLIYQPTNRLGTGGSWPSQSTQFSVQAPRAVPTTDLLSLMLLGVLLLLVPLVTGHRRQR